MLRTLTKLVVSLMLAMAFIFMSISMMIVFDLIMKFLFAVAGIYMCIWARSIYRKAKLGRKRNE